MTGRVKDYFHDEICAGPDQDQEPDELEILAWESEQAQRRLDDARKKHAAKEGNHHGPL